MAYRKIKDLAVKTGEYQKDGHTKPRFETVGAMLKNEEGKVMLLLNRTFNPAGVPNPDNSETCMISVFDLKNSNNQSAPQENNNDGKPPF